MMEQSKRSSLSVARSILNHKVIGKKLESFLKVCVCSSLTVHFIILWTFSFLWPVFCSIYVVFNLNIIHKHLI